jgi:4-alpha-glucanotransferase
MNSERGSGVLLHISSLPSRYGIGDMGPEAYQFADFLTSARQKYWQILPLNPTDPAYDNSPYHSTSAIAANPLFISPDLLVREGLLTPEELNPVPDFPADRVDFLPVIQYKHSLYRKAFERFKTKKDEDFNRFCVDNGNWLTDFALFVSLKERYNYQIWNEWPEEFKLREPQALYDAKKDIEDRYNYERFLQYVFMKQWRWLRDYCAQRNIRFIGDMPIYVDFDSADVWTAPHYFKLDEKMQPYVVSGVPPDYFSATGQLWGNPIYNWQTLQAHGFDWWVQRMKSSLAMYDLVRIDHFRGLVAYWEVAATEETAIHGQWVPVPVMELFDALKKNIPTLNVIAEDLGLITQDVKDALIKLELPGMKVLSFAFNDDMAKNPYVPHNIGVNSVVYTGTHDNNTVMGWWKTEAPPFAKENLHRYLGWHVPESGVNWAFIRMAMMSVGYLAVTPVQDLLGLDQNGRMNVPGTCDGNWRWRLAPGVLDSSLSNSLRQMTEMYGRA